MKAREGMKELQAPRAVGINVAASSDELALPIDSPYQSGRRLTAQKGS